MIKIKIKEIKMPSEMTDTDGNEVDPTGIVTATLECPCGSEYKYNFMLNHANIHTLYMAEEIAWTHVQRCAPALCVKCTLQQL